jgi:hypothetical protein
LAYATGVTAHRGRDWSSFKTGAEGATAPETLRQKDRVGVEYTLESRCSFMNSSPKEKVGACRSDAFMKTLRFLTEGASLRGIASLNLIVRRSY